MIPARRHLRLLAYGAAVAAACAHRSAAPPAVAPTPPDVLCSSLATQLPCRSSVQVEDWLRSNDLRILATARAPEGRHRAGLLTLAAGGGAGRVVFRAKWRLLPSGRVFSSSRTALVAPSVQKLFLEPDQYVAPPAAAHCFPLDEYRERVSSAAQPAFGGLACVLGVLSYWIEGALDVEQAHRAGLLPRKQLFDEQLWERDPLYRKSIADMNIFTYLINHGDPHSSQFVVTRYGDHLRVFSVDHDMAFTAIKNPLRIFREDWSHIIVPALPQTSVDRLAAVSRAEVERLAVVERFAERGGVLWPLPVAGPPVPSGKGTRWAGDQLIIGLEEDEIDGLWCRLQDLLRRVYAGELPTF